MTDPDQEEEIDLIATRRARGRHQASVLKIRDKLQTMLDEDNPASLDTSQLEDTKSSIETFFIIGFKLNEKLARDEEDADRIEEDERDWDLFQNLITTAKGLCRRLQALRGVYVKIQTADKFLNSGVGRKFFLGGAEHYLLYIS